jgi:hypothetical protein
MARGVGFGRFPVNPKAYIVSKDLLMPKKLIVAPCELVVVLAACSNSSGGR